MADLTTEDIALGIRAARAGWRWQPYDIVRELSRGASCELSHPLVIHPLTGGLRLVATRWDGVALSYQPEELTRRSDGQPVIIPDPTARGFVSAALAQVRERTDQWWYVATAAGVWWLVDDQRRVLETAERHYPTEVEAVVAALEATR